MSDGGSPLEAPSQKRGRGRPKGSRNRWRSPDLETRAAEIEETGVRAVIFECFRQLGGIPGMVEWGRDNKAAFYRLFAQCGPRFSPQPAGRRAARRSDPDDVAVTDFTQAENGDGEA